MEQSVMALYTSYLKRDLNPSKKVCSRADAMGRDSSPMSIETIVIIVLLVLLFGGGGGYWFSRRR
jgi:hypothetical protein